ncbi:MAG: BolA/IbaG family iron-sulfur metabolism protein [Proteobacteria bacterium]|nr:BolA/IbaG family iron-sulfur metabolism protein [Pseudomonadota bacterium]
MHDAIKQAISDGLPGAEIDVLLDGNRALITVISEVFRTMSRVQKQQAIYGCIQTFISDGSLHAVTIKAQTPDEV